MSNDLVSGSGGGIQPYQPATGLPASSPATAGADYLADYSGNQNTPTLFGQALPPGANAHHIEATLSQLAAVFANDMGQLKASSGFINEAIRVFKQLAVSPVPHENATHGYNLTNLFIHPADAPYVVAFCNQMARLGADQEDVRKAIYWISLLYQKVGQAQQPQTANTSSISDVELNKLIKTNDKALVAGDNALRAKWGYSYQANLNVVRRYVTGLSVPERERLETAVIGDHLALNDPEVIEGLYQQAIASAHVPSAQLSSGTNLNDEIAKIENLMRTNRRAYNKDPAIQARLRELYDLRGG